MITYVRFKGSLLKALRKMFYHLGGAKDFSGFTLHTSQHQLVQVQLSIFVNVLHSIKNIVLYDFRSKSLQIRFLYCLH